jgi:gamma-glutamyltranspeptidase
MRPYLLVVAGLLASSSAYAADPEPVAGSGGMVVSAQHIASEVGQIFCDTGTMPA